MGVFGPKYPRPLQEVVSHAERFCGLLARLKRTARADVARAWLMGRSEEVELVFERALGDWANGRRSMEDAARSMTVYLLELHTGARERFGLLGELDCCDDDVFLTVVASDEAETRVVGATCPPSPPSIDDTWFDASTLLAESDGANDSDEPSKR